MADKKFVKKNGFPTLYGYACGYGKKDSMPKEFGLESRKSIFEDESHNCLDVKYTIVGIDKFGVPAVKHYWEQFFYVEFPSNKACYRKAESFYQNTKL